MFQDFFAKLCDWDSSSLSTGIFSCLHQLSDVFAQKWPFAGKHVSYLFRSRDHQLMISGSQCLSQIFLNSATKLVYVKIDL